MSLVSFASFSCSLKKKKKKKTELNSWPQWSVCSVILVGQEPGTEFKEGANIIRYKVYDLARNRAACKFIVRVEGKLPTLHYPDLLIKFKGTVHAEMKNQV